MRLMIGLLGVVGVALLLGGCALTPQDISSAATRLDTFSESLADLSSVVREVDSRAGAATAAVARSVDGFVEALEEQADEIAETREMAGQDPDDPYSLPELLKLGVTALLGGGGAFFGVNRVRDGRRKLRGEPVAGGNEMHLSARGPGTEQSSADGVGS